MFDKVTYNSVSEAKILKKSNTIPHFDKHVRILEVTTTGWFRDTTLEMRRIYQCSREAKWRYTNTNKYVEDNDAVVALCLASSVDKVLEDHGRGEQTLSDMS